MFEYYLSLFLKAVFIENMAWCSFLACVPLLPFQRRSKPLLV